MASKPAVLVITGHGLNCESESRTAWEWAGATVELVHLNDLLAGPAQLHRFQVLMFIGGFSFGDHMGSGLVMALRMRNAMADDLLRFIGEGRLVMGVCNGFQVLVQMGLLPGLGGSYLSRRLALMQNDCGAFQNRWVELKCESTSPCIFTRGIDRIALPVRHGEGKIFATDLTVLEAVEASGGVACRYIDPGTGKPTQVFPWNPNGSQQAIAGLCDPTGRVFGMMPHPEAYLLAENHPTWEIDRHRLGNPMKGEGLRLFRNAVEYFA
jgi:phosphoribosylformylglycinamidine synthase I